jgi:hypothetical protein
MYRLGPNPQVKLHDGRRPVVGLTPYPTARNMTMSVDLHVGDAVSYADHFSHGRPVMMRGAVVGTYVTTSDPHFAVGAYSARSFVAIAGHDTGLVDLYVAEAAIPLDDAGAEVDALHLACPLCGFGIRPTGRAHRDNPFHKLVSAARNP